MGTRLPHQKILKMQSTGKPGLRHVVLLLIKTLVDFENSRSEHRRAIELS
jgi:hypothetical protein